MNQPLVFSVTPVMSATPDYSSGDAVGTYFQFPPNPWLTLMAGSLVDLSNVGPDLRILIFNAAPTGTYTDNAAIVLSTADKNAFIDEIVIAAADWKTTNSTKLVSFQGMLDPWPAGCYGVFQADGAWNAASVGDLIAKFRFEAG